MRDYLLTNTLKTTIDQYPFAEDYFMSIGLKNFYCDRTIDHYLENLDDSIFDDYGMDRSQVIDHYVLFMMKMVELAEKKEEVVRSVTIKGGQDKFGIAENLTLTMRTGEIICIVGPTGSGKSRLLADIECLAQMDTPTGRQILINNQAPESSNRFSIEHKLVAQLSQNMNFIMDLTVGEFIEMHAESRVTVNVENMVTSILTCANELAGEKFSIDTPITSLSGGQSRALMIADTALLSRSPIVLIDEIENAGVDRKKALELLVKKEKIVLMATHDPILALMGDRRIVIKNGGIHKIIETGAEEKKNLQVLQKLDTKILEIRNLLRSGEKINFKMNDILCDIERMAIG